MPPIGMFRDRQRPNELVFASCAKCNNGTRKADLAATYISRMYTLDPREEWKQKEFSGLSAKLDEMDPDLRDEVDPTRGREWCLIQTLSGMLIRAPWLRTNGPRLSAYLTVFSAKFAMAIYRELMGHALPMEGIALTTPILTGQMHPALFNQLIRNMPVISTLRQGNKHVGEQFSCRYASDGETGVTGVAQFQQDLRLAFIVTSTPDRLGSALEAPRTRLTRPGGLLSAMPASP